MVTGFEDSKEAMKAQLSPRGAADVLLRFAVSLLSLTGLMLLVRDEQTVVQLAGDQSFEVQVKYSYVSGFVYLVYSNGLAAIYCFSVALSLLFGSVGSVRTGKLAAWVIFVTDQVLAYILLAAASASSEVAYLADKGDEKTTWAEICSQFGHFCQLLRASIAVTFVSVFLLAVISVMSAHQLFKKYRRYKAVKSDTMNGSG